MRSKISTIEKCQTFNNFFKNFMNFQKFSNFNQIKIIFKTQSFNFFQESIHKLNFNSVYSSENS